MTDIKTGDRVHIETDQTVQLVYGGGAWVSIDAHVGSTIVVPAGWCTTIVPPLRVGDVLDTDAPEPPTGTVVIDRDADAWKHAADGWYMASCTGENRSWNTVRVSHPLRVVYLPGATS